MVQVAAAARSAKTGRSSSDVALSSADIMIGPASWRLHALAR